jgi:hypothetical protein
MEYSATGNPNFNGCRLKKDDDIYSQYNFTDSKLMRFPYIKPVLPIPSSAM